MAKKITVGITGGMGAGKTVVARMLTEKGFLVFSADEIAKELTATGSPILSEIVKSFGSNALNADGSLNRSWLRSQISQDPGLRKKLDGIMHPAIQKRSQELMDSAHKNGASIVFYEAPLLFEASSERNLDAVVCVWAQDQLRLKRVQDRDHKPAEEVKKLMDSQMPQEEKKRRSQHLIENNGDLTYLRTQVENLLAHLAK